MEERKTIFDYLMQVMVIFGFSMMAMMCFTMLFGESAKEISALFSLGDKGLSVEIMAQFLGLSAIVVLLQYLFFTDRLIKKMSEVMRCICMVILILLIMSLFIIIFQWFPVDMWQPWVLFILCFIICFAVSTFLAILKTKLENKRLEQGLENMKRQWKEQGGKNV